jgi:hypothetical protein
MPFLLYKTKAGFLRDNHNWRIFLCVYYELLVDFCKRFMYEVILDCVTVCVIINKNKYVISV